MMSEPFFGCRNPRCAEDVTYPADMLALHPEGGPICEHCWEDDDARYNGDETLPTFESLPAFVPKHERNLRELAEAVEAAEKMFRWYGDLHAGKTPPDTDKAKRNYDMARQMAAVLAKAKRANDEA